MPSSPARPHVLVVTAVEAERDAVQAALAGVPEPSRVRVVTGGVGPAESAVAAAVALGDPAELVLCAGVGGGFAPLATGQIAVASSVVFADLGAETDTGFRPVSALGLGASERYDVAPKLAVELADRTGGRLGTILTVATVTGSCSRATDLTARYPDAVAEGMEGAGVAAAAARRGVPCGEIRAISNAVGPRDRDLWRIPEALAALGRAVAEAVS